MLDHDIMINDFARRAFRDSADMDYIAARLALRAELFPQFLWSSLQAFEKYFKYILLVNRISSKDVGHNINKALSKIKSQVVHTKDLHPDKLSVFKQVATYGQDRYLIGSWAVRGPLLAELDAAIWDVRRYCHPHLISDKSTDEERRIYDMTLEMINGSRNNPNQIQIPNGFLEKVLADKHHPSYSALHWKNAYFGKRLRKTTNGRLYFRAENAPLYLYPEMLNDLDSLIKIKPEAKNAYAQLMKKRGKDR